MNLKEQILKPLKNEGFKKYASNTGWLFSEQILRSLSGILVGVWVARYLGPEQFGIYSYAISFVVLFGAIAHLGLQVIVVRELINKPDQEKSMMGTALYMQVVGALVLILLISSILPFTSNDGTTNVYILIIASGLIFQSFQVIDFYFQSKVLARYVSICRLVQLTISSILKIGFVLAEVELIYFVVVLVIDNITLAIALCFAYWKHGGTSFHKFFDLSTFRFLIRESWPLIVANLVHIIYMRIDQVMIKEMMDAASVGVYSAAVRFSEAWYFVPVLIGQSLFPAIINAKKNSNVQYIHRLQILLNVMMAVSVAVGLFFTFYADFLIEFFYGESYKGASTVLSLQVWAGIFVASGVVANKWYIVEGYQKYTMYPTSVGALLNVVLNLLLIPKYGIVGSAVATLVAQMVASVLFNALIPKTRKIFLLQMKAILGLGLIGNKAKQETGMDLAEANTK